LGFAILDNTPMRWNTRFRKVWPLICATVPLISLIGCGINDSGSSGGSIGQVEITTSKSASQPGSNLPREIFEAAYARKAPWDIGRPQPMFVEVADRIQGTILDAGCGTGDNALYFAGRGHAVVGIDFVDFPIREAKRKSKQRGLAVEFIRMDALALTAFDRKFDNVIDSGLFHCLEGDARLQYVAGLAHVTRPGGKVWLACFRDDEIGTPAPKSVSQRELRNAFDEGWTIEAINPARFTTIPTTHAAFRDEGPKAWFAVIRRNG
jgi:SAM-dependent methyltransferase